MSSPFSLSEIRRCMRVLELPRATFVNFVILHFVATMFESFSVAMMLPVAQLMIANGDVAQLIEGSRMWRILNDVTGAIGFPLSLPALLAISFLSLLLRQGFTYAKLRYFARKQQRLLANGRARGFALYLNTSLNRQDQMARGRLVNDLVVELERSYGIAFSLVMLVNLVVMTAIYFGVLLALSASMTLATVVTIGVSIFVVRNTLRSSTGLGRKLLAANQAMSSHLVERIAHTRLIRLAGAENAEIVKFRELTRLQGERNASLATMSARTQNSIEPLVVGLAILLLVIGHEFLGIQLAEMGLFVIILVRLLPVAREGIIIVQTLMSNYPSLQHVIGLYETLAAAAEPDDGDLVLERIADRWRLKDVVYRYDTDADAAALNGVTLDIPARRITAIVGPSGAGKSTLIDLLPRLREPQSGSITIDGAPLARFRRRALRTAISYAPQSVQILNVTAAQHIRYGWSDATDADVVAAARLAGADQFISALPQGYDTLLGESGVRLSGGQRQRLDLARALVRRSPLVILDEPTSNLDPDAQHLFHQALQRIRAETEMTIIVVAHQLSAIDDADQIIVLMNGRVADAGTHDELMARGGWYADACAKQRGNMNSTQTPLVGSDAQP